MFSGSWKESTENVVHIQILDPSINLDCEIRLIHECIMWIFTSATLINLILALRIVLGSLYQDELIIVPNEVVSVLATAALLQLDAVVLKCGEVMAQTVNIKVTANNFLFFLSAMCSLFTVYWTSNSYVAH